MYAARTSVRRIRDVVQWLALARKDGVARGNLKLSLEFRNQGLML